MQMFAILKKYDVSVPHALAPFHVNWLGRGHSDDLGQEMSPISSWMGKKRSHLNAIMS